MSEVTPTLLHGRYEVVAVVGRGGEGTLVRAVDRRHGRDVALKLRRVPGDPRDAERLLVESRTLLSLRPHPGLPLARDDFFDGDHHVLVMDWVDGVDLSAVLTEHGRPGLPPSTVLRWLAPVAEALTHLHTTDPPVVHGDVKPANLVLTPTGQVVLVDFGVSSTRGLRPRGGTQGYRAPEVAAGALPTRAADVYGLAATTFALLAGGPPTGILPAWEDMDFKRAKHLEQALRRGLATNPTQRTATPGELVEELRAGWDAEPLPTGVLSFLATEVVSSSRLWQELPDTAPGLLAEHLLVVDRAVERHGGRRVGDSIEGDATISVFHRAGDAVRAGIDLQRDLVGGRVQIHCAAHTGEAVAADGGYVGATLSRVVRIRALADAGQLLVSATTARLAAADLPADVSLVALGPHRLAGFDEPEVLLAVEAEGLAVPPDPSVAPYPGLASFQPADHHLFFGREELADQLVGQIGPGRVVAVVGASGCGKSSLVRAGVVPRLRDATLITPGEHPLALLPTAAPGPLVVDQFEELVTLCDDTDERAAFADRLVDHRSGCLVTVRADLYGRLADFPRLAAAVAADHVLLGPLDREQLRRAIEGPAEIRGLALEPGLTEAVLADAQAEPGALPLVAHALSETWLRREGRTLSVAGYRAAGGVKGALAQTAEQLYAALDESDREILRAVLLRMVEPGEGIADTRRRVGRDELTPLGPAGDVGAVLERLATARLVSLEGDTAEPAHEALLREWPRLRAWIDDAREELRLHRNITAAAREWELSGRDPAELYRGARLARALDWRQAATPQLTPAEESFLDAGQALADTERSAAEDRVRQQARQNRRLRTLLAAAAVLLVVAIVAGLLAVRQARRADRAAVAADARRVGAQAQVVEDLDRSMLLAVEGMRLDDSTVTRANLLAALSRSPELIASARGDGPVHISLDVSPDGTMVGVGKAYGSVSFFDANTREQLGTYDKMPVWKWEFRPDGKQIVFSGQDDPSTGTGLPHPIARLVDAETLGEEQRQLGGVPADHWASAPHYSADGRFLAVAFEDAAGSNPDSVIVWDMASPEQPVQQLEASARAVGVELSPDGSTLYVGTFEPAMLTAYDVATGRPLRSASLPSAWLEMSRDGSLLAVAGGNEIVLLDPATLKEVRRLQGHSQWVEVIRFSHDAELLASGSDDRTVIVWDVSTGEQREVLRGYSSHVDGVGFSPDDETLYTTSGQTWLAWDLAGNRRFIARRPLAEPADAGFDLAFPSPTGEAVAYIRNTTDESTGRSVALLQLLDLNEGRARPAIDTRHVEFGGDGTTAWRPDGQRLATAGGDGFVRVWDRRSGILLAERELASGGIGGLSYTGDGQRLVVAEEAGRLFTVDAETLEPDGEPIPLSMTGCCFVSASPDNRTAIALSLDRFALVELATGRVTHEGEIGFPPEPGDFYPDGRRFAVGGYWGQVRVLDVDSGQWVGPPQTAHEAGVWVAYSPDGATIASGGADGAIALWDGQTGTLLNKVSSGRPRYVEPAFLPDGHTLLISSPDTTVSTWDTRPETWVEFACAIAGRNFTEDEWRDAFGTRPYRETCPANPG